MKTISMMSVIIGCILFILSIKAMCLSLMFYSIFMVTIGSFTSIYLTTKKQKIK